jgi:mRNA interferase RelE/StbE
VDHRVEFKPSAAESFRSLDRSIQRRFSAKLESLKQNPRPPNARKLQGENDLYRIRTGDYRLIYQVQDQILLILVLAVGNRKDIYRMLTR